MNNSHTVLENKVRDLFVSPRLDKEMVLHVDTQQYGKHKLTGHRSFMTFRDQIPWLLAVIAEFPFSQLLANCHFSAPKTLDFGQVIRIFRHINAGTRCATRIGLVKIQYSVGLAPYLRDKAIIENKNLKMVGL